MTFEGAGLNILRPGSSRLKKNGWMGLNIVETAADFHLIHRCDSRVEKNGTLMFEVKG